MINQFSRTQLMLGEEAMQRLSNSSVAVIGLGAAGASCAEALARSAVGRLALFSGETITENMLRGSIIADTETTGLNAADVAEKRLLSINSEIKIDKNPLKAGEDIPDFSAYDYVVNASADWDLTLLLAKKAQECGTPIISVLDFNGALSCADVRYKIADINKIPAANALAQMLRKAGVKKHKIIFPSFQPGDSPLAGDRFEGINACALGLIAAGEAIKDITGVRN